jgi:hypothetical protein
MPAILANANEFALTSDYPIEQVIYLESGSYTLNSLASSQFVVIPHGLPFTPLVGGGWALVSDFSVQYNFASGTTPSTAPSTIYAQTMNIFADSTNVYIEGFNTSASDKTIYYRIFGLQPTDDDSDVTHTKSEGDDFIFNTDYLHLKVAYSGYEDLPATAGSEYDFDITHGFSYTPICAAWKTATTFNGTTNVTAIHPIDTLNTSGQGVLFTAAGTGYVELVNPTFQSATRVHWRIYT